MNYDFDTLYNESKRESFASGKELFYDDAVRSVTSVIDGGKSVIKAIVKDGGIINCAIIFDEDGLLYDYECSCGESDRVHGPCRHIVATALSYEEKHPTEEIPVTARKSDADVVKLVFDYNKRRQLRLSSEEVARAEVVPYVSFEGGISLSLTVGFRKQYAQFL